MFLQEIRSHSASAVSSFMVSPLVPWGSEMPDAPSLPIPPSPPSLQLSLSLCTPAYLPLSLYFQGLSPGTLVRENARGPFSPYSTTPPLSPTLPLPSSPCLSPSLSLP